ncbi:MAG: twin-arginine translocase TatA/TatE family subunit [Gemmatimonadaceae bacterium]
MFDGFGPEKLLTILLIVTFLFGARRLPELGGSLGRGIKEFKRGIRETTESTDDHAAPRARLAAPSHPPETAAESVVFHEERAPKRLFDA